MACLCLYLPRLKVVTALVRSLKKVAVLHGLLALQVHPVNCVLPTSVLDGI